MVNFDFYRSKLRKQPFCVENVKIHGGQVPPPPSDAHVLMS